MNDPSVSNTKLPPIILENVQKDGSKDHYATLGSSQMSAINMGKMTLDPKSKRDEAVSQYYSQKRRMTKGDIHTTHLNHLK